MDLRNKLGITTLISNKIDFKVNQKRQKGYMKYPLIKRKNKPG